MKQYKLTAWPELPTRFQKTPLRRVVSELTQRFASARDLARSSGAPVREVSELISHLNQAGLLMSRDAPLSVSAGPAWREWWPIAAVLGAVKARR